MNRKIEHTVTEEQSGQSLGRILRSMGLSERQIRSFKFIDGAICINGSDHQDGRRITTGTVVLEGQKITVLFYDKGPSVVPMKTEEMLSFKPEILWEDPFLVFLNKPTGLVVHPAGAHYTDTLANYLAGRYQEPARLIGRLDKETSGVIAAARDPLTLGKVEAGKDSYQREYVALVHGNVDKGGEIDTPLMRLKCPTRLGKNGRPLSLMLSEERRSPEMISESSWLEAITGYEPLGKGEVLGKPLSLLRVIIKTGRMHQIRTHMASIGHPLLFDGFYGIRDEELGQVFESAGLKMRTMLHSHVIRMVHPVTQEFISVTAPYPEDMTLFVRDFTWF